MSPMDEHDLALVGRLRPEPTPDEATVARHRDQLQAVMQAAASASATTSDSAGADGQAVGVDEPVDDALPATPATAPAVGVDATDFDDADLDVVPLTGRDGRQGRGRSWRRTALAAAAAVVVLGGVVAAVGFAGGDRTTTGENVPGSPDRAPEPAPTDVAQPGQPVEAPCGTELPFDFPAPAGYEGPVAGPSGRITVPSDVSPYTFQAHWRSADATIDVRWPSTPPLDPTTPHETENTNISEFSESSWHEPAQEGDVIRGATFDSLALGVVQCVGLDVIVTSSDGAIAEQTLDDIEIALAGPGGPLEGRNPEPLVTGSTTADTLPEVAPCRADDGVEGAPVAETTGVATSTSGSDQETVAVTVEGGPTYSTPTEALALFLVTEPGLMRWGYEEVALPDGSYGYVHRAELPGGATGDVMTVVHVVHDGEGWTVTDWQATGC